MRRIIPATISCLILAAAAAGQQSASAPGALPLHYFSPDMDKTPKGGINFHGPFGRDTFYVAAASSLPAHEYLDISFDLILIRTWDGSVAVISPDEKPQPIGPDYFRLGLHNGPTLLYTTFSNMPSDPGFKDESKSQNYPSQIPGDLLPPQTGSVSKNSLGYGFPDEGPPQFFGMDSVYHIHFLIPHHSGEVLLEMSGINLQDLHDESWGVANVQIRARGADAVKKPDAATIATAFKASLDPHSDHLPDWFQTLIDGGDNTVAWIGKNVQPAQLNSAEVANLIKDLQSGDEDIGPRDAAHKALLKLGHAAEPALRDARRQVVGDQRLRIDWVLATMGVRKPEENLRQVVLATRVLEIIGTPEALALRKSLVAK